MTSNFRTIFSVFTSYTTLLIFRHNTKHSVYQTFYSFNCSIRWFLSGNKITCFTFAPLKKKLFFFSQIINRSHLHSEEVAEQSVKIFEVEEDIVLWKLRDFIFTNLTMDHNHGDGDGDAKSCPMIMTVVLNMSPMK